jgi:hypothetical protein
MEKLWKRSRGCVIRNNGHIGFWSCNITVLDNKVKIAFKKIIEDIDANFLPK